MPLAWTVTAVLTVCLGLVAASVLRNEREPSNSSNEIDDAGEFVHNRPSQAVRVDPKPRVTLQKLMHRSIALYVD